MNKCGHLTRFIVLCLAAGAAALVVSACGGSNKPPASRSSAQASNSSSPGASAYRYSACMRKHGVSNFQDPQVKVNGNQVQVAIHVDPSITGSPDFKSAQSACAHILPGIGNGPSIQQERGRTKALLAFARCMRQHGFPKFPDPTSQGQLTLAMIGRAGIDLHQPAVKPAAYACAPLTHGLLTRADINQALASPNASGSHGSSAGG